MSVWAGGLPVGGGYGDLGSGGGISASDVGGVPGRFGWRPGFWFLAFAGRRGAAGWVRRGLVDALLGVEEVFGFVADAGFDAVAEGGEYGFVEGGHLPAFGFGVVLVFGFEGDEALEEAEVVVLEGCEVAVDALDAPLAGDGGGVFGLGVFVVDEFLVCSLFRFRIHGVLHPLQPRAYRMLPASWRRGARFIIADWGALR